MLKQWLERLLSFADTRVEILVSSEIMLCCQSLTTHSELKQSGDTYELEGSN